MTSAGLAQSTILLDFLGYFFQDIFLRCFVENVQGDLAKYPRTFVEILGRLCEALL